MIRHQTSDIRHQDGTHHGLRLVCGLWSVVCGLLCAGCIHRSLTVKTNPPGAMVYLNDELKGTSPVTYDFIWYGWYRLTLRKDGFERLDDRKRLNAPFYLWIPFDLFMELLPFSLRDARTWSYTLTPAASVPTPLPPSQSAPEAIPPSKEPAPTPPAPTSTTSRTEAVPIPAKPMAGQAGAAPASGSAAPPSPAAATTGPSQSKETTNATTR